MKDLIIPALQKAWSNFHTPTSKLITRQMVIDHVSPIDLLDFMKANNIPLTASFGGRPNGYDGFDAVVLEWDVEVPTTVEDNQAYYKKVFNTTAFRHVHTVLTEAGYKRLSPSTAVLKNFPSVYEMLWDEDQLEAYYSLYFGS